IGRREVLPLQPVERLVDEQWEPCGHQQLEREHTREQRPEHGSCAAPVGMWRLDGRRVARWVQRGGNLPHQRMTSVDSGAIGGRRAAPSAVDPRRREGFRERRAGTTWRAPMATSPAVPRDSASILPEHLRGALDRAQTQVNTLVLGKAHEVRLAFVALLSDGHLLIEDLPGLGKTTLAHALAATLGLEFQRVQFTSD